ncbi:MAG: hypothetical protein ACK5MP_08935 [Nostocoides sp.]
MGPIGVWQWWQHHRRAGTISWSLVTLFLALVLLAITGMLGRLSAAQADEGIDRIGPGLFVVDPAARAIATLGDGWTVSLQPGGLRIARQDVVYLDTATKGSPLTAVTGSVHGRAEQVEEQLATVRIDGVNVSETGATWTGTASGPATTLPVLIRASRVGNVVHLAFQVEGADAVMLNLDWRPNTVGVPPTLPERNLRLRAWWAEGSEPALFSNSLLGQTGVTGSGAARAVDLREDGLVVVHVWDPQVVLRLTAPAPSVDSLAGAPTRAVGG